MSAFRTTTEPSLPGLVALGDDFEADFEAELEALAEFEAEEGVGATGGALALSDSALRRTLPASAVYETKWRET